MSFAQQREFDKDSREDIIVNPVRIESYFTLWLLDKRLKKSVLIMLSRF